LLITTFTTNAQLVRSFSNEFLNIGIGARALGMSKAVSSFVTGVEAGYWNPAGVITVQDYEFAAMHNSLFNGIGSYDYFGAALPIERDDVAMSISVIRLGVDNILNTTNLIDNNGNVNFNNLSTFSSSDVAAIFSIAKAFPKLHLNVGINGKIIRRNIGDFATGNGFGFDIGAQYELNGFKLGLVIRDVTTTFTAWSIDDDIFEDISNAQTNEQGQNQSAPEKQELTLPKFQLGASYSKKFNEKYTLLAAVDLIGRFIETNDLVSSKYASFSPNLGLELEYKNKIYFRAGIGNIQKEIEFEDSETDGTLGSSSDKTTIEPSLGIGILFKSIHLDYALTNVGAGSGINYSNVFSIKVKLNEMR